MLLGLIAGCLTGWAQGTNGVADTDYSSFRIISERNIFNPNRSARTARSESGTAAKPVKVESFALVGTLQYSKGSFAFFDGSASEFRKVAKTEDRIAGCRVASITPDRVTLEADGREFVLSVGMQMKRQDEGEWQAAETPVGDRAPARQPEPAERTESAGAGSGGGDEDALIRLMRKREQEMNNEKR